VGESWVRLPSVIRWPRRCTAYGGTIQDTPGNVRAGVTAVTVVEILLRASARRKVLERFEGVAERLLVLPHVVAPPGFPQGEGAEAVVREFGTIEGTRTCPSLSKQSNDAAEPRPVGVRFIVRAFGSRAVAKLQ